MDRRSTSHLQKVLVAACFAATGLVVGSCSTGVDSGNLQTIHRDPSPPATVDPMTEALADIAAAAEAAETCRKVIDKPLRCLP